MRRDGRVVECNGLENRQAVLSRLPGFESLSLRQLASWATQLERGVMSSIARVLVLMATYNGQEHLAEQLDSILSQEGVEVFVRVSDDCSTDSTFRILETYASEHDNIEIIYNSTHQGKTRTIMQLVYDAPVEAYDYIALANQDDIWLSGKLAAGTDHISANTSRPELYYAGSVCIDARGRVIGDEFDGYEVCASHPGSLLLVRNWALGCTMLMNGALVKLLRHHPVFDFARSYDTWIHAVALYCDGYVFCDLPHCYVDRRLAPGQSVLPPAMTSIPSSRTGDHHGCGCFCASTSEP